jgi:hypothetical protein
MTTTNTPKVPYFDNPLRDIEGHPFKEVADELNRTMALQTYFEACNFESLFVTLMMRPAEMVSGHERLGWYVTITVVIDEMLNEIDDITASMEHLFRDMLRASLPLAVEELGLGGSEFYGAKILVMDNYDPSKYRKARLSASEIHCPDAFEGDVE